MVKRFLLLLVSIFASCCFIKKEHTETVQFTTLDFYTIQYPERENFVFQDEEVWEEFAAKYYTVFDSEGDPLPPPEVDLKKHTLIAVFMGRKPNGGYGIRIKQVRKLEDTLLVTIKEHGPDPNLMVIQVITYPSHFILIPKTYLPARFEYIE